MRVQFPHFWGCVVIPAKRRNALLCALSTTYSSLARYLCALYHLLIAGAVSVRSLPLLIASAVSVAFDAEGTRYGKGKGLMVWVDGSLVASSPTMQKLTVKLV